MKKKTCIVLWMFAMFFSSCVCLQDHQKVVQANKNLSNQLRNANKDKEAFQLLSDTLQLKNNAATEEALNYQASSTLFQYQLDSLFLDSEERESTAISLTAQLALLTKNAATVRYKNIIVREIDTVAQIAHEIHSGKIAFYCPSEMYYNQTYDVYGLIADVLSNDVIKKMVVKKIKEHTSQVSEADLNNTDFLIRAVQFYEIIELKLDSAVNTSFAIVKVHLEDAQIIANKMESWHWKITPLNTEKSQQLILKVIVQDANGGRSLDFSKTYPLQIKIKPSNFFHNTKVLFVQNPKWAFGTILLPLLTFFGGRYQRRKKGKIEENL